MSDELDPLLSQLPFASKAGEDPDEAELVAWREGRLADAEVEAVDARLVADAEARRLAIELARPADAAIEAAEGAFVLRPRWPWFAAAGALAAAVLVGVFLTQRLAEPPEYSLEVRGTVAAVRSDGPPTDRVVPDSQIEFILRPGAPAHDTEVSVFVVSGEARSPRDVRVEKKADGAYRLSTTGRALFGDTPGPARVIISVHLRDSDTRQEFERRFLYQLEPTR